MPNGTIPFPHLGAYRVALVDDLLHLLFDQAEIFGGERLCAVEIIIPAILDHRSDGDLHIGPDLLNRAGHDMREIMPDQLQRRGFVFHGIDGDAGVPGDGPLQIPVLAIDLRGDGFFRQRIRDACRHIGGGDTGSEAACVAIGKGQENL